MNMRNLRRCILYNLSRYFIYLSICKLDTAEVALHRCSYKKVFWKYAANLRENNHVEVWFQ